jgi:predicted nucleic acid-binding protein
VPRNVAVDAGPIVSFLVGDDAMHTWTKERFSALLPPLLTCEPVLSEAGFILERLGGDPAKVPELVEKGVLRVAFGVQEHAKQLTALMRSYANVPMSLADACLVRMTELLDDVIVVTFDADFRIYRRHRRLLIPLLAPEGI